MTNTKSRGVIVERLAKLVVERPWWMLLAGVLLFAALVPGVGRVYHEASNRQWFEPDDPNLLALDSFEERFGSDNASLLVIHSPSGIFDKESAELVIEVTDEMWKVAETMRVESVSNFSWVHAEGDELIVEPLIPSDRELTEELLAKRREVALNHEQIPGLLVSPDGKTAVVYGWLEPAVGDERNDFIAHVESLKELVEKFEGRGDHEMYIAGYPAMEAYLQVEPNREMQGLTPLILGMCVVLLFVFFRRPAGFLLPLVVVIPSVLATVGIAGWAEIPMSPVTVTAPNIIVILAISNSVHVLFNFFRALNRGVERRLAAQRALERTLRPAFFACLTTGVGFLSLLATTIPPLQQLGLLIAPGTLVVWLLICLYLGPLMVLLPLKRRGKGRVADDSEDLEAPDKRAERLTAWISRYKVGIVAGWVALVAVSVVLALQNQVKWDPIEFFDESTEVRVAHEFLEEQLGWSETLEIVIDSGEDEGIKDPEFLRAVEELGSWLSSQEKVVTVVSLVDILKDTNRVLFGGGEDHYRLPDSRRGIADQYLLYTLNLPLGQNLNDRITIGNDALRMTALSHLEHSSAVNRLAEQMRTKAEELGLDVEVTGKMYLNHQIQPQIVTSASRSILSAVILIGIILLVSFRSLSLGLLSLFTNLIPLVIGAGAVFFVLGKTFDVGSVGAFTIALGVAVDDTVHFLLGYNRLRRMGLSSRQCVSRLFTTVGPAMVISTSILVGCFGLFLLITFPVLWHLGVMVASMLILALLVDLMLVPALMLLRSGKTDS